MLLTRQTTYRLDGKHRPKAPMRERPSPVRDHRMKKATLLSAG